MTVWTLLMVCLQHFETHCHFLEIDISLSSSKAETRATFRKGTIFIQKLLTDSNKRVQNIICKNNVQLDEHHMSHGFKSRATVNSHARDLYPIPNHWLLCPVHHLAVSCNVCKTNIQISYRKCQLNSGTNIQYHSNMANSTIIVNRMSIGSDRLHSCFLDLPNFTLDPFIQDILLQVQGFYKPPLL